VIRRVVVLFAILCLAPRAGAQEEPAIAPEPPPPEPPEEPSEARPMSTATPLRDIPIEAGLPIHVRVAARFVDVGAVEENDGVFRAMIDVRTIWRDPRLEYDASEVLEGYRELRGEEAAEWRERTWVPVVGFANVEGDVPAPRLNLRLYPDGLVESIERYSADFRTEFDVETFPFDRQELPLELVALEDDDRHVTLEFTQDDLDFSRHGGEDIDGWQPGSVDVRLGETSGLYGAIHSSVVAALAIDRDATKTIPSIFIPIFASLLIPMIAIWLNKMEGGDFKVEAFELTNIVIGGLFAVIALNFTVFSEYTMLASNDNLVSRLFGLNYIALALSLGINMVFFRYGLVKRWFGVHVQAQVYSYLTWAIPVAALATAGAIVLSAIV
jgi:hypothetical protein